MGRTSSAQRHRVSPARSSGSCRRRGPARSSAPTFGADTATIAAAGSPTTTPTLTIQLPPDETTAFYWRAVDLRPVRPERLDAGPSGPSDAARPASDAARRARPTTSPTTGRREPSRSRSRPADSAARRSSSPGDAEPVDQPTTVELIGRGRLLRRRRARPAREPVHGDRRSSRSPGSDGGLTETALRAAGTDYPAEIVALYARHAADGRARAGRPGAARRDRRGHAAPRATPYDLADDDRDDAPRRRPVPPTTRTSPTTRLRATQSIVECFALTKRGYCQYYASTMAILLRERASRRGSSRASCPATRDAADRHRTIRDAATPTPGSRSTSRATAGSPFDPTGGGRSPSSRRCPSGRAGRQRARRGRRPASPGRAARRPTARRAATGRRRGRPPTARPASAGPLIAIASCCAVVVAAIARSSPGGAVRAVRRHADGAYGTVARLAARLGFGPRPTQTVYEYAGALAEVLPEARPELETVARGQGRGRRTAARMLGDDRLHALREAQRRLRVEPAPARRSAAGERPPPLTLAGSRDRDA